MAEHVYMWLRAQLWDATDGSPIGRPMEHGGPVFGAVFNQVGARILTWSYDGTARLWYVTDRSPIALTVPAFFASQAFSADR